MTGVSSVHLRGKEGHQRHSLLVPTAANGKG